MNENWNIIMKTAIELANENLNNGWFGDCNDFTQASTSVSQELTNLEVERLWDEFADGELLVQDMTLTFTRYGEDKIIKIEKS